MGCVGIQIQNDTDFTRLQFSLLMGGFKEGGGCLAGALR